MAALAGKPAVPRSPTVRLPTDIARQFPSLRVGETLRAPSLNPRPKSGLSRHAFAGASA
jgi:hypothetical protein